MTTDLNGNRTQSTIRGVLDTYAYEAGSNRLDQAGIADIQLDANGNTVTKVTPGNTGNSTVDYAYTPHNRLAGVTRDGILLQGNTYNGLGQRVQSQDGAGATRQYVFGPEGQLLHTATDTVQEEYVYLNGVLIAQLSHTEDTGVVGQETLLDDGDPGTSQAGIWTPKTSSTANEGDYLFADKPDPSTYRWTPTLTPGTYQVDAWWRKRYNASQTVPFSIVHDGQTDVVLWDQSTNSGQWNALGSFDFSGIGGEYVEVSNANGRAVADAVRFTLLSASGGGRFLLVDWSVNGNGTRIMSPNSKGVINGIVRVVPHLV